MLTYYSAYLHTEQVLKVASEIQKKTLFLLHGCFRGYLLVICTVIGANSYCLPRHQCPAQYSLLSEGLLTESTYFVQCYFRQSSYSILCTYFSWNVDTPYSYSNCNCKACIYTFIYCVQCLVAANDMFRLKACFLIYLLYESVNLLNYLQYLNNSSKNHLISRSYSIYL